MISGKEQPVSTQGPPAGPDRSAVRWLGIGLILSLAINAFIVGLIATKAVKQREVVRRAGAPALVDALGDSRRLLRALPKERRKELRGIVRSYRPKLKPHRDALDAARDKFEAVLRAEPTDQAALTLALDAIQNARFAMRDTGRAMLTDVLAAMTPDERRQVADRLARSKRTKKKPPKKTPLQEKPSAEKAPDPGAPKVN